MEWEVSRDENSSVCYNLTQDTLDSGKALVVELTEPKFLNPKEIMDAWSRIINNASKTVEDCQAEENLTEILTGAIDWLQTEFPPKDA